MDLIRRKARVAAHAEVTIEANPEDVTPEAVRSWLSAGVNRVSLGVQSFHDSVLEWMHRTHDAATARRAVHALRDAGLSNISIDLIFATPPSVTREWTRDLEAALELQLPHLSVYGLTVETQTPLGRWVARRDASEAPEETFEREFLAADASLAAAGYEHYEVSNFGTPGYHSRHNWAYWRRSAYAGLGPSAHEFDGETRRWNVDAYAHWIAALERGADPLAGSESLTADQIAAEELYLGLRTSDGIVINESEARVAERWVGSGWARLGQDRKLRLTPEGWLRLDALVSDLTMLRSRY